VHEAICDTSPIQYLHQIGFLHLLAEFYTRIIAPLAVVDELERGRAIGVDLPDVRALPWLTILAPEGLDKVPTAADLGAGEKEVLALGTHVPGAVVILDERLGRLHAAALKLSFTGTLGIPSREGRRPDSPHRTLTRTSGPFRIPLIGENTRGSPPASWRMS
jgi:predicted nucleic acid-binding protein